MRTVPAGYQKVLDLFGPDPLANGDVWFFDPTSDGDATGESPEKALRTAADFNKAKFAVGDACVFKVGTTTLLTEKMKNNKAVGREGNPFYIGAYHMMNGKPVHGLGGKPRPCIDGLAKGKFDPYGGMNKATVLSMIPTPGKNADGTFNEGTLEGLFNWYQSVPYDLMLWVQDIATRYSGGRGFRFSQGDGGRARGLYMLNCYSEGTMKQSVHLAGVYDAIIKNMRTTLSGFEIQYYTDTTKVAQAALATKGTTGDPDTPCNVWFDEPLAWCGWSTEAANSNSGNRGVGILDAFAVDNGCYGYYHDRTADMFEQRCIAIRTDNEKFKDYRHGPHGRGTVGLSIQNEGHDGSFDWTGTYNTPEDFANYQTRDNVLENNIAIGFAFNLGFQSQASCKKGYVHEGRPSGAGVYLHGCLSINPAVSHWNTSTGNNNDAYVLDKDNPPRVWGCAHIGAAPFVDRTEDQFADVFRGNYFDREPPQELAKDAVIGGLKFPIAEYDDLSVLMEKDENGWMNEAQALAFRDKVKELLVPEKCINSPIKKSEVKYPPNYTMSEFEALDFNDKAWGTYMPVGPFADGADGGEVDIETRVSELEKEVAELDERVTELEDNAAR